MCCAFELDSGEYVPGGAKADEVYGRMLKKPAAERLRLLRNSEGPQGQFLWAILRNGFHYAAVHLGTVADNARDMDQAMRWGFGLKQGPFELWQEAGWLEVATMIQEDIDAGKALCNSAVARLGIQGAGGRCAGCRAYRQGFVERVQSTEVRAAPCICRSTQRQHFREDAARRADVPRFPKPPVRRLYEDDAIRLWTLDDAGGDREYQDKDARDQSRTWRRRPGACGGTGREASYEGLVIWSNDEMFSGWRRPAGHVAGL
jgi:3-hydroxyacyl-CoA dehydrogenase